VVGVATTSLVQVVCKSNIRVIYMPIGQTVNNVGKDLLKKGDSLLTATELL
jgi:hypothetical protein